MTEIKKIKFGLFGLVIVGAAGVMVYRKVQDSKAGKLAESGDTNAALLAYKKLFASEVETHINSDGSGNVQHFLTSLDNKGRTYLDKISNLLEQQGIRFNTIPYDSLVTDVSNFSEQSGVMNFRKEPVKDGKKHFAEFYQKLTHFTESIPEKV